MRKRSQKANGCEDKIRTNMFSRLVRKGLRSRAALKLEQINKKYKILMADIEY